jgi:hypothetical protein
LAVFSVQVQSLCSLVHLERKTRDSVALHQCSKSTGDPGRTAQFEAYQPLKLANRQKTTIDNIGENRTLANIYAKENAANLAGFNDAKTTCENVQFPDENSAEWAGAPAIILRHFCGVAA